MRRDTGDPRPADAELVLFWEKHRVGLLRYCLSLLRDTGLAEDVLHESFARLARAGLAFRDIENPEGWLFSVAKNCCISAFRRGKVQARLRSNLKDVHAAAPPITSDESLHDVREHLRRLWVHPAVDDIDRQLIELWFEERDTTAIADKLGMSPQAVNQRKRKLKQRAQELENRHEDDAPHVH
ncbi:MAG: hypothetical protein RL685_819 [Pseudomonadota bacterium]|jgi:RNA polymerase sigma factor (sigma-70 family)